MKDCTCRTAWMGDNKPEIFSLEGKPKGNQKGTKNVSKFQEGTNLLGHFGSCYALVRVKVAKRVS